MVQQHEIQRLWTGARRYFLAGLAIVLPTFLTLYILWFLFGVVAGLLAPFLQTFLRLFFARETVPLLITPLSVFLAAALVWLIGLTGATFSRRLFERTETAFGRIPFVRSIMGSIRQIIDVFAHTDTSFKQVAVIEYPRRGLYCLCFVTNPQRWQLPGEAVPTALSVFIPTTPNPTSGFFLLVPEKDVTTLDISVDEAIKVIISGGIVTPRAQRLPESPFNDQFRAPAK